LPQLSDIIEASEEKFRLIAFRSDADQYAKTLRIWQQRLEANKEQAEEIVGHGTYRRYLRYLRISRAMFERRDCTLFRLVFERRASRPRQDPAS
jgi:cyclopropane fatty-acyl-phospholipid synthase-like methyltransferase